MKTWIDRLDAADADLVGRLLREVVDGPYFPDWEFHTLFGLQRAEVAAVADAWPAPEDGGHAADVVIQSVGQLRGYPHGCDARLQECLGLDDRGLEDLRDRVRRAAL